MAEDYTKMRGMGKKEYYYMPKAERKELRDNRQASEVYDISTDSEKADLDRLKYHSVGNKGYPRQAFEYDY